MNTAINPERITARRIYYAVSLDKTARLSKKCEQYENNLQITANYCRHHASSMVRAVLSVPVGLVSMI